MSEMPNQPMGEETPENKLEAADDACKDSLNTNEDISMYEPLEREELPVIRVSKRRGPRKLSLTTFIISSVALVLAAVMATYTVTTAMYKKNLADVQEQYSEYSEKGYPFELFSQYIEKYSFGETDENKLMAAALKAYIEATGDKYATYYTAEEYAEYQKASTGKTQGVGISIVEANKDIQGTALTVIEVINVVNGSPAEAAGVKKSDLIYKVGIDENAKTVDSMGYDLAIAELAGEAGTKAEFVIYRPSEDKFYDMSIERAEITTDSVYGRVHSKDSSVGVVVIFEFDLTTPKQFKEAMDDLIAKGCTNFIFDVRDNPGGDLRSIQGVLGLFLKEGDVNIRTVYRDETEKVEKVEAVTYTGDYADCSLKKEEIGKYRDKGYKFAVLCNGSTASAAELFTATFRDYGLGIIVGTRTYGKGSMQSIIPLSQYGYGGALKLTTAKYFSGGNGGMNDGYDGVGISPVEEYTVTLPDEVAKISVYERNDADDTQLSKALECFKYK